MENRIFISYSHKDKEWANEISALLRHTGFHVWKDDSASYELEKENCESIGIAPGEDWIKAIASAIRECKGFILLVSEDYMNSFWCKKEWNYGCDQNGHVCLLVKKPNTILTEELDLTFHSSNQMVWDSYDSNSLIDKLLANAEWKNMIAGPINLTPMRSKIVERINGKLEDCQRQHQSFKLMGAIGVDPHLFPDGVNPQMLENKERFVSRFGKEESISFKDFFRNSWKSQQHLIIDGQGGIGKTVALLSFATENDFLPFNVVAVYIPLYELAEYEKYGIECIDKYIEDRYSTDEYKTIEKLSKDPWKNSPNLILLLDGYNEASYDSRNAIEKSIRQWCKRSGTQVVTTSRTNVEIKDVGFERLRLLELSRLEAQGYLERNHLKLPTEEKMWEVINTPLMLRIYAEVEYVQKTMNDQTLRLKPSNSTGNLMWNFLMTELRKKEKRLEYVIEVLLIAPYIAFRMLEENSFTISNDLFVQLIEDACDYWKGRNCPTYFRNIEHSYRKSIKKVGWDSIELEANLIDEFCLFWQQQSVGTDGEIKYSLMHQSFRDCLAALHLYNIAEQGNDLPNEFKETINKEVLEYLSDFLDDSHFKSLWVKNRYTADGQKTDKKAFYNLLQIYILKHGYDLSDLDYSGMDLTDIYLTDFREPGSCKLLLSKEANHFVGTKLNINTFLSHGHSEKVTSVALSGDGNLLVSGSKDMLIKLWNTVTGEFIGDFKNHKREIRSVAISNDGKVIASGSEDSTVKLWNSDGELITTYRERSNVVESVSLSNDGKVVASGMINGAIKVRRTADDGVQTIVLSGHTDKVNSVCLNGDGTVLVSGSDDHTVRIWELTWDLTPTTEKDQEGFFDSDDDSVNPIMSIKPFMKKVNAVSLGNDASIVAAGSEDGEIILWERKGIELNKLYSIKADTAKITSIAINRNGNVLVGSYDNGIVKLWNIENGRDMTLQHSYVDSYVDCVNSVAIDNDGRIIAGGSDDYKVRIWDAKNRDNIKELSGSGNKIEFSLSANGKILVTGSDDRLIRLWNIEEGRCKGVLEGHKGRLNSVALNKDGSVVASASSDTKIRIWKSGKLKTSLEKHTGEVNCISMDETGQYIVSGSNDKSVILWNINSGNATTLGKHSSSVKVVEFSANGKFLSSISEDGEYRQWKRETGECLISTKITLEQAPRMLEVDGLKVSYDKDIGVIRIDDSKSGRNHELHVIQWLNLIGLDFSKTIIESSEDKIELRQNGIKVDENHLI